jgi:hypothetical protein
MSLEETGPVKGMCPEVFFTDPLPVPTGPVKGMCPEVFFTDPLPVPTGPEERVIKRLQSLRSLRSLLAVS